MFFVLLPAPASHTKVRVSRCWEKANHRQINFRYKVYLCDTWQTREKGEEGGCLGQVVMEDLSGVMGALSYDAGGEALCGVALNLRPVPSFSSRTLFDVLLEALVNTWKSTRAQTQGILQATREGHGFS